MLYRSIFILEGKGKFLRCYLMMVRCTEEFHRLLKVLADHSEVAIERTGIRLTLVPTSVIKIVNATKVEHAREAGKKFGIAKRNDVLIKNPGRHMPIRQIYSISPTRPISTTNFLEVPRLEPQNANLIDTTNKAYTATAFHSERRRRIRLSPPVPPAR